MKIDLSKGGEWKYVDKSLQWIKDEGGLSSVTLAGERLLLSTEEGETRMFFMGYVATGFSSQEEARRSAPDFACQVFDLLKQRVLDFPPEMAKSRREESSEFQP